MPRDESYEAQNAREAKLRELADKENKEFLELRLKRWKEELKKIKDKERGR